MCVSDCDQDAPERRPAPPRPSPRVAACGSVEALEVASRGRTRARTTPRYRTTPLGWHAHAPSGILGPPSICKQLLLLLLPAGVRGRAALRRPKQRSALRVRIVVRTCRGHVQGTAFVVDANSAAGALRERGYTEPARRASRAIQLLNREREICLALLTPRLGLWDPPPHAAAAESHGRPERRRAPPRSAAVRCRTCGPPEDLSVACRARNLYPRVIPPAMRWAEAEAVYNCAAEWNGARWEQLYRAACRRRGVAPTAGLLGRATGP